MLSKYDCISILLSNLKKNNFMSYLTEDYLG